MTSQNIDVFIPVLILMFLAAAIVLLAIFVSKFIRPHRPSEAKELAYECGELPQGTAWSQFNIRFYVVGLIFIIFDVESALMFPVVSVFKELAEVGLGGVVLVEVLIFLFILIAGMSYCWKKVILIGLKVINQNLKL